MLGILPNVPDQSKESRRKDSRLNYARFFGPARMLRDLVGLLSSGPDRAYYGL